MTNLEREAIAYAINEMVYLINQLEPDPEYREMFGVDRVLLLARGALNALSPTDES